MKAIAFEIAADLHHQGVPKASLMARATSYSYYPDLLDKFGHAKLQALLGKGWMQAELEASTTYCHHCEKDITVSSVVWLELNCCTGTWHLPANKEVPEDKSQGVFPFGATCAKRMLAGA